MARLAVEIEVPMGHRLQNHKGKCKFPHGHNYRIRVVIKGQVGEDGMVADFSEVKGVVKEYFKPWDHCFVLENSDPLMFINKHDGPGFSNELATQKVIRINYPPTAEILALIWREELSELFVNADVFVEVFETEKCSAEVLPTNFKGANDYIKPKVLNFEEIP